MSRKDPANFGSTFADGKFPPDAPEPGFTEAAGRFSVVMPERVILALLRSESDRLAKPENVDDLREFFMHFFDPMISEDERESYVTSFQRTPPVAKLGYPRTGAEFPCLAIVMERDAPDQEALGRYLGETQPGDPAERAKEYLGSMYEQTYGVYIYATHPDMCMYLYHFSKGVLTGSDEVMAMCGLIDPAYDGNEMNPEDTYLPENMFVRRLGVTLKSLHTVPVKLGVEPGRIRVVGIHADDIVVGGIRGGVHAIDPTEDP